MRNTLEVEQEILATVPVKSLREVFARELHQHLSADAQEQLRNAVLAGIAWLEKHEYTEWPTIPRIQGFSISDNGRCMLGLLTGLGFNMARELYGLSLDKCKALGFIANVGQGLTSEKFLTQLWSSAARHSCAVS